MPDDEPPQESGRAIDPGPGRPARQTLATVATAAALVLLAALAVWVRVATLAPGIAPPLTAEAAPGGGPPSLAALAGEPVFLSADAYYHYRMSRRLLSRGHRWDRRVDGTAWDDDSFAPAGRPVSASLLQRLQVWAWHVAPPRVTLAATAFYLPAAAGALLVLLAFALGRTLAGPLAGLLAAAWTALQPELLSHTHAGMSDTSWLALTLLWLMVAALAGLAGPLAGGLPALARRRRRGALLAALAAAALAALALAWAGWPAAAALAALWLGPLALAAAWRRGGAVRWATAVVAAGALTAVAVALVGTGALARLALYLGLGPEMPFPDPTTEVQELAALTPGLLVARLGGVALVGLAAWGVAAALPWVPGGGRRPAGSVAWLLVLWALPAALAAGGAMRFAVYAVPPLVALAAGGAVDLAGRLRGRRYARTVVLVVALVVCVVPWRERWQDLRLRRPSAGAAMTEAASAIRDRSPRRTLINAWWDHGYAYAELARRGVVVDGGSYTRPRLYWLSRVLAADDERTALNLLRLIDCGHEEDFWRLLRREAGPPRAMRLAGWALAAQGPRGAFAILTAHGLAPATALEAADLLACRPPPAFLVVSSDLAAKTTSWARFGAWRPGDELPPSEPRVTVEIACRREQQGEAGPGTGDIVCDNGFRAAPGDLAERSADGWFAAEGAPRTDGLVPILHQRAGGLRLTYARRDVAASLFARLYYFHGHGLERFRLEHVAEPHPGGERVLVYRILWR